MPTGDLVLKLVVSSRIFSLRNHLLTAAVKLIRFAPFCQRMIGKLRQLVGSLTPDSAPVVLIAYPVNRDLPGAQH